MKSVINNETLPQAMWDEENRLKHVYDENTTLSSYLYDAGGERTLKLWDGYQYMMINGQQQIGFFDITDYTLYTSSYMVLTPEQYTKHYYAESDRIVSKIGGGMQNNIYNIHNQVYGFNLQSHDDYLFKSEQLANMMYDDYNQLGVQADLNANFDYWLNDAITQDEYEGMIFFYHKDLPKAFGMGSSTQISDPGANIIQHIEYLPYGETFFERRDYWNTPYKFNAKELDAETGMYYYGARYYTPEVSIWLSVDPLADKYPSMSPYMYCAGNPVVFIDPNGMEIDNIGDGIKNFFKGVGNLLRGRGWNANHKTRLVKNQDSKEDVMNARFRDGDFVGWVSNSYLNKLASKTGDNFQDLLAKITNELSYSPPAQSPISYKSYEDVVKHYQSELSHTTSMKAPTVKRITGQASLSYTGLTPNYRFDIDNQKNKWSYFGSPPGIIRDFNLSRKNIVTTSFSRLQPGFGNANTPAKGDLFHLNGAFYHFEVIATPFSYSLSVPVKR